jgi:hypothetical protein
LITYDRGAVRPDLVVRNWADEAGTLIDCSGASAWQVKIGKRGQAALLTKTALVTGAATNPQIRVQWVAGELDFAPGDYTIQIQMTKDLVPRIWTDMFTLKARVL